MIYDKKNQKSLDRLSRFFNRNSNPEKNNPEKKTIPTRTKAIPKAILKEEKPVQEQQQQQQQQQQKKSEIAETFARLQELLNVTGEPFIQQYAYKVAYETDQKCVKPQITIYSNELETAIKTGVLGLKLARTELQKAGFVAAPLGEVGEK
jgi:hypothetical protein